MGRAMKGRPKRPHARTSIKGKTFVAGRGSPGAGTVPAYETITRKPLGFSVAAVLSTLHGPADYTGTEVEDSRGKWNQEYAIKDGYWVIHTSKYHHVYSDRQEYSYDWKGYGLILTDKASGRDVFLQGDEGSELHDQLEAATQNWQVNRIIEPYFEGLAQGELDKIQRFVKESLSILDYKDWSWDGSELHIFRDGDIVESYERKDLKAAGVL